VEKVFISLPRESPYRQVLDQRSFNRVWAGLGYLGKERGFWRGLGLDITLSYSGTPYRTGIPRIDRAAWQQHWTLSHRALPRWRFRVSEEAGSYVAPDISVALVYRMSS
jgi:hypothetical protein